MCCLQLKKIWDDQSTGTYLYKERRFTPDGYLCYWMSVDAALKFWDKTLADILIKKQKKSQFKLQKSGNNPGTEPVVKSTVHKITKPTTIQRRIPRPPPK